jgi:TetR/AcrR family transcriptional regulator, transcriptional repressor for nem operon
VSLENASACLALFLALALLAAVQGGVLLTQIQRDTKPLEAALDAMLELIARLSGGN